MSRWAGSLALQALDLAGKLCPLAHERRTHMRLGMLNPSVGWGILMGSRMPALPGLGHPLQPAASAALRSGFYF